MPTTIKPNARAAMAAQEAVEIGKTRSGVSLSKIEVVGKTKFFTKKGAR